MKKVIFAAVIAALGSAGAEEHENLFANSEFDEGTTGWGLVKGVERMETMAMSGQWVIHAVGPMYHFMTGAPKRWERGRTYTLAIKARSLGSGSALRIVQMGRRADGKVSEGTYATMLTAVGPEFHEYYIPFTTKENLEPLNIAFYKVDSKDADTGLDIDSVRMFEGKITPFEVRKIGRPGRQAPVAGTAIPLRPNPYGRVAKPFRALVATDSLYRLRDAQALFAETGVLFDQIMFRGKNEDVYSTDGDPKAVIANLRGGKYDLYVMSEKIRAKLGPQFEGLLVTNLQNGAKLYTGEVYSPRSGAREGLDDFPYAQLRFADTLDGIVRLVSGEGDLAGAREAKRTRIYGGERHEISRWTDAQGATVAWKHAVSPFDGPKLGAWTDGDGRTSIAVDGVTEGLSLRWKFLDFSGRVLAEGETAAKAENPLALPLGKLWTNLGLVRLELVKGAETVDRRTEDVYARELDLARVYSDYTPSMWPMSSGMVDTDLMYAQLADMGMRASEMPTAGSNMFPLSYRSGLAIGGNSIAGGTFWLPGKLKTRRREPNFNTAAARERLAETTAACGAAMKRYGVVQCFLQDEAELVRYHTTDEVDNEPENIAVYRDRMQEKYGTIEKYNRRHQTAHRSFRDLDEALLKDARESGKFAEFIEWRNFNVDRWCEAIRIAAEGVKSTCPDMKVSLLNSFGESPLNGNDYWKMLTKTATDTAVEYTHTVYFGRDAVQNIDEYHRSWRPDMRIWGYTGYFYTPDRAKRLPWYTAFHRHGGFTWFAATSWGYNLIDLPSYSLTVDAADIRKNLGETKMLDGLGKVLTAWRWAPNEIGIYYSHDSLLVATCLDVNPGNLTILDKGIHHDFVHSRWGAQDLVESVLCQYDYIAPEQIVTTAKLDTLKLVFMPRVIAMSDAEIVAMKRFLLNGGAVVCDQLPGDYDELGVKRAANPFAGVKGITVTGASFSAKDEAQRAATLKAIEAAKVTKCLASDAVVKNPGLEAFRYVSGGAEVYGVLREWGEGERIGYDVKFNRRGHVYDARRGRYLGLADRAKVSVEMSGAEVFAVLPAKIDALQVSAPATLKRGEDFAAEIVLRTSSPLDRRNAVTAAYVVHAELVPPSGSARFHFGRNLETKDGAAKLVFPIALNDEKGRWKLRVNDALTGVAAEHEFRVE